MTELFICIFLAFLLGSLARIAYVIFYKEENIEEVAGLWIFSLVCLLVILFLAK